MKFTKQTLPIFACTIVTIWAASVSAAMPVTLTNVATKKADINTVLKKHQLNFSTYATITCEDAEAMLVTQCVEFNKGEPFCHSQTLSVANYKKKTFKKFLYTYSSQNSSQSFISKMQCIANSKTPLLILHGTNFGNCESCEWVDVFSVSDLHYLGSTRENFGANNFSYKRIPKKFLGHVENTSNQHSISIYRTRE